MSDENKNPWFGKGFGGLEDAEKRQKEKGNKFLRLWIEEKKEKRLCFLDEEPFARSGLVA